MENGPHHPLSDVKTMLEVFKALTQADFYKSMKPHSDHRV